MSVPKSMIPAFDGGDCDCNECKAYRAARVRTQSEDAAAVAEAIIRQRTAASAAEAHPFAPPQVHDPATLLPNMSSEKRKQYPLVSGCLDYFPDALLAVAHISYIGNQKHNPGQPIHWNRGKSQDEMDALGRHITERGEFDMDGALVDAQVAWRALANLQKTLEKMYNLPQPRGCSPLTNDH